mmetsp:Transcript_11889/g.19193  ORF Transcript_11889/g.19193 Transcript_11889/m.19193 type:complete len:258 (+) Transcript_11889:1876-2649(+)
MFGVFWWGEIQHKRFPLAEDVNHEAVCKSLQRANVGGHCIGVIESSGAVWRCGEFRAYDVLGLQYLLIFSTQRQRPLPPTLQDVDESGKDVVLSLSEQSTAKVRTVGQALCGAGAKPLQDVREKYRASVDGNSSLTAHFTIGGPGAGHLVLPSAAIKGTEHRVRGVAFGERRTGRLENLPADSDTHLLLGLFLLQMKKLRAHLHVSCVFSLVILCSGPLRTAYCGCTIPRDIVASTQLSRILAIDGRQLLHESFALR